MDTDDEGGGGGEHLEDRVGQDRYQSVGVVHGVDQRGEGGGGVRQPRVRGRVHEDLLLGEDGREQSEHRPDAELLEQQPHPTPSWRGTGEDPSVIGSETELDRIFYSNPLRYDDMLGTSDPK